MSKGWDRLPARLFRQTPKGAMFQMRLYVYPDGHGHQFFKDPKTKEWVSFPYDGHHDATIRFAAAMYAATKLAEAEQPASEQEAGS